MTAIPIVRFTHLLSWARWVALCVPATALCQALPDSMKTYQMDPVIVTATQTEALRSRVPNAISLVTKADIKASGETSVLPVIGRLVPGVFVTQRGVLGYGVGQGAAGEIAIRGTGGSPNTEVLVLTDGRPQMMGLFGHPLPDTYVSSGVERVEIIRGPASLLYGTNAMGGVINIIYEKPTIQGLDLETGASYGTFNTAKYEIGSAYGTNAGGISASGNHYQTDGHRAFSSFRSNNGSIRGNMSLNELYSMNADVSVTGFRTYDPGPASSPAVDHWVDVLRGGSGISIEDHFEHVQGALKTFFNWGRHDIYDGFHSTDNNLGLLLYQALQLLPENVITIGVDYKRYGGVAENRKTGTDFGSHFVFEYSAHMLLQQRMLGTLTTNAGVRLNHHSLYGSEVVPQIGLALQVAPATTVKASASKGFRSPTIRELFLFPAPTPTLQPERIWNYEISLLHALGAVASFEITGFISDGSNLIRTAGVYPSLVLSNSGNFIHRGIEFTGRLTPDPDLEINCTYNYLAPGDQTMANPRHKAYLGGRYAFPWATVTVGVQHIRTLYGDDYSQKPLPDYTLANARVTTTIAGSLALYVAVENILDHQYQILYDYPMPGRTAFAGLNWAMH